MEERIPGGEHVIQEMESSAKENIKSKLSLRENNQEIWESRKRPNLRIIGVGEGEESQVKGKENIFNKIIQANFPNLNKDMCIKFQKAYRTPI